MPPPSPLVELPLKLQSVSVNTQSVGPPFGTQMAPPSPVDVLSMKSQLRNSTPGQSRRANTPPLYPLVEVLFWNTQFSNNELLRTQMAARRQACRARSLRRSCRE